MGGAPAVVVLAPATSGSATAVTTTISLQSNPASSAASALHRRACAASWRATALKRIPPRSWKLVGEETSGRPASISSGKLAAAAAQAPGQERRSARWMHSPARAAKPTSRAETQAGWASIVSPSRR